MSGMFLQYNGDSLYLAAFAACLGFLYYQGRKTGSSTGKKAVAAIILSAVLIFNEAAYQIMGKVTDATSYYRFFWMLPVTFLIAYQFARALFCGKKGFVAAACLLFAVCLLFGANFFFLNKQYCNRPLNIYGLDPNTITAADAIMEDWGRQGQKEKPQDAPVAAFDMYLGYQIRTYEPRIHWAISRKAYLYQAKHGYDHKKYVRQQHIIAAVNEGKKADSAVLRRCLEKNGVDYLVIRTEFDMDSYLSEISVQPIAKSISYTLYKVNHS